MTVRHLNRELSWLAFDRRVLSLAEEHGVPLLERLKFAAITSSNLDEFFQVRVAALKDQVAAGITLPGPDGLSPQAQIEQIRLAVERFVADQEAVVLDQLLPKHLSMQIWRAMLESEASEHGARMTAMDSATKNAKEMVGRLTLEYNRARQAAITKELMEIVSGSESLKS